MRTHELGRTGEQISQLALGCMLFGTDTDERDAFEMLDRFVDAGGTFLDTANCYAWWAVRGSRGGQSEEALGRWLARSGRRDEVFVATKVGGRSVADIAAMWPASGGHDDAAATSRLEGTGAAVIREQVDESLRRLRTDRIDLYYVHVDDRSTPLEETLEALSGLVDAGKIRYIGWSNVRTWRLERIRQLSQQHGWRPPVSIQQQHSYLRPGPSVSSPGIVGDEQLDYLREHDDLTLVAYMSILKGVYDSPAKRASHGVMNAYRGPDTDARLAVLDQVAGELGATPNQVVLAWLMAQRDPCRIPLTGPRTLEQFELAMGSLKVELHGDHLRRLDDAGA